MPERNTKRQIYKLEDVFTPSTPATLTFIERENHALFESYMREHGRPICLEGPFQAGKTSLILRISKKVFPNGAIHVICNKSSTVDSLIQNAFHILRPYYHSEVVRDKQKLPHTFTDRLFSTNSETSDPGITKDTRLPIELISPVLAMFAADAVRPLIIDDAHKLAEKERQQLADVVREWQTQVTAYGHPKIVIVASDVTGSSMTRSLLASSPDLATRIVRLHLPRMSPDELRGIIRRGGQLLNLNFSDIEDYIIKLSIGRSGSGRPGYTHDLCRHACVVAGITETTSSVKSISREQFEKALEVWSEASAANIQFKFDDFFANPPKGTPAGFCIRLCQLLDQKGLEGLPFSDVSSHLAEPCSARQQAQ
jgi:hypothetical protein